MLCIVGRSTKGKSTNIKVKFSFVEEILRGAGHASLQRLPPVWPRSMWGKGGQRVRNPRQLSVQRVCTRAAGRGEGQRRRPPAGCVFSCREPRRVIWVLSSLPQLCVWGRDIPLLVFDPPKNGGIAVGMRGAGHGHAVMRTAP